MMEIPTIYSRRKKVLWMTMQKNQRPIGVFDSGVGGISVLRELRRALPHERFIYYGDGINAPYGVKTTEEVIALSKAAAEYLLSFDVKAIVIACNTATAASHAALSACCPVPVIGIEPAVALANTLRKDGKVLAMATPGTIKSERFANILREHGEFCIPMPCGGLMEFVERGEVDSPALHQYFDELLKDLRDEKIDVAVMGCTHYPFVKEALSKHLPEDALFVDGSMKTLQQLKEALDKDNLFADDTCEGGCELYSSAGEESIRLMQMLLEMP